MTKRVGFDKQPAFWRRYVSRLHRTVAVIFLILFVTVRLSYRIQQVRANQSELLDFLPNIAVWSSMVDQQMGELLWNSHVILEQISQQQPLFPQLTEQFDELLAYFQSPSWSSEPLRSRYPDYWALLSGLAQFPDDIKSLLGATEPQTYLVLLQNTAESRPNGGFFGSFVRVTLDRGVVTEFEIVDSYLPGYDSPGTYVTGPEWLLNYLPEREIYFVGANKVGFTYVDGAHILNLYEKSYPGQQIRGVIFVSTDMFLDLIPDFQQQLREWQFVNATVDLIRGEARRGKKELYLVSSQQFFAKHQDKLVSNVLMQLPELIKQRHINIYLEDISGKMHGRLRRNYLTTRYEDDHAYFWDSNISFNKSDQFVEKIIQFTDQQGQTVIETTDQIVSLAALPAGEYHVSIYYQLHVPEQYFTYIDELIDLYGITLNAREERILVLNPERATRGLVYLPPTARVTNIGGDIYHQELFTTPFARALYYKSKITENNTMHIVEFDITL